MGGQGSRIRIALVLLYFQHRAVLQDIVIAAAAAAVLCCASLLSHLSALVVLVVVWCVNWRNQLRSTRLCVHQGSTVHSAA
jgi:hypothetical protein